MLVDIVSHPNVGDPFSIHNNNTDFTTTEYSEQEFMDECNATAVTTAKKVAELMKNGQLPLGWYL